MLFLEFTVLDLAEHESLVKLIDLMYHQHSTSQSKQYVAQLHASNTDSILATLR